LPVRQAGDLRRRSSQGRVEDFAQSRGKSTIPCHPLKKVPQQAGTTLSVLPHFRPSLFQREHVFINSGVIEIDGVCYPRTNWRPISPSEFAVLTGRSQEQGSGAERAPALAPGEGTLLSLLELPRHLRERWWSVAEQLLENLSVASGTESPEGRGFFEAVLEFLQFKCTPLTALFGAEIIVHQPGLKSSFSYPASFPGGAELAAGSNAPAESPFLYMINLGDEPTSVWFLSVSKTTVTSLLNVAAATLEKSDASVHRFVTENPDCPPIRIKLQQGEGFAAWPQLALLGCDTLDQSEPDILLRIAPRN
jgi:hypothetical protein